MTVQAGPCRIGRDADGQGRWTADGRYNALPRTGGDP